MNKITIVNGMADDSYSDFEKTFTQMLNNHNAKACFQDFYIRNMNIKYCCGCWSCWLKTPGKCSQEDEMPKLLESIINSDLTVFVSPIHMGFVSANIKKVNDKMIPLAHPYIEIFNGECHHIKRYDKYPKLGLLLIGNGSQSKESHGLITGIYKRIAINMKTELAFSILSDGAIEEVEYAINNF